MFEEFERIENADLKQFSTMRTGGSARVIVFPKNHLDLIEIYKICKEKNDVPLAIGNGSNVLFDDAGFDGVIVSLKHLNKIEACGKILAGDSSCVQQSQNTLNELEAGKVLNQEKQRDGFKIFEEKLFQKNLNGKNAEIKKSGFEKDNSIHEIVSVGAGINLFVLNQKLAELGLSGMEWSYGIPASLGGMIVGNGGCFGHEMADFVEEVTVLDDGKIKNLQKDDLRFSYRNSNLRGFVVLQAKLRLKHEKSEKIKQNMQSFLNKKRESQPCEFPSLGSIFKQIQTQNETIFPAKLIDEMGLKGFCIGGAQVSTKHAGFIINKGGATSQDVLSLIHFLETKLAEKGVQVEREIIVMKKE